MCFPSPQEPQGMPDKNVKELEELQGRRTLVGRGKRRGRCGATDAKEGLRRDEIQRRNQTHEENGKHRRKGSGVPVGSNSAGIETPLGRARSCRLVGRMSS